MKEETSCNCCCSRKNAQEDLPGAAINEADGNKVDEALVEERTKTLNNNPRNNDDKMPG